MIPIGDSPKSRRTPWVTYAFITLNVLVFIRTATLDDSFPATVQEARAEYRDQVTGDCYGFVQTRPTDVDRFYCRWSFQPQEWFDAVRGESDVPDMNRGLVLVTILTSIFVHGGLLHILGNMLFLWVFGDNVEDRLGHAFYAVFYLLGGFVASLTQGWVEPDSLVPTVGASGAVAAVLGAYIVYFPKARVTTLLPFFPFILIPFAVPAFIMIGLWFLQNLLSGFATLSPEVGTPDSGVAFFAHIGGFVFGAIVAFLFIRRGRRASFPAFG
jgi:membrane associated rhomboid family serine protease